MDTTDYDDDDLWEPEEDDERQRVAATDILTDDGKVRVHRRRCGTCIYWPENRMMLNPGRREQMEADADAEDTFIPCHQTLPYGQYDVPPAICHGYFTHAKDTNWRLRWANGTGDVAYVDPPCTTWERPQ